MPSRNESDNRFAEEQIATAIRFNQPDLYLRKIDAIPDSISRAAHITDLTISGDELKDLSSLRSLNQLVRLRIIQSKVVDLTPLSGMSKLRTLHIRSDEKIDVAQLGTLPSLITVYLNGVELENCASLAASPLIESLTLSATYLFDGLEILPRLRNLSSLYLSSFNLSDLSTLSECQNLTQLGLFSAHKMNLSPLENLTRLHSLSLAGADISDLSPISKLRDLVTLSIRAKVSNLEPLAGLSKLENLDIRHTGAKDLTPLARLVGLMVGTQKNPTYGGLSFSSTTVLDPFIRSMGRKGRSERVRTVLEYLRRKAGLSTLSEATAEWLKDSEFENHWEVLVDRIPLSSAGAKFVALDGKLSIDPSGDQSDHDAAESPLTKDLHDGVKRRAIQFAAMAQRLDNQLSWHGIGDAAKRFAASVDRPSSEIPNVIGTMYESLIELGSFLEFDNRIRNTDEENAVPLDAEVKRAFTDLIRASAPWARQFPTARRLDEEAGAFLSNKELFAPSRIITTDARDAELISKADSAAMQHLLEAALRGDYQSNKAGNRGTGTARNLVVKAMGILAAFYVTAVNSDFATKSLLVQRAGTFLATSESSILALFTDLPADIRQALMLMLDDLQRNQIPMRPTGPREIFDPHRRPDDDNDHGDADT